MSQQPEPRQLPVTATAYHGRWTSMPRPDPQTSRPGPTIAGMAEHADVTFGAAYLAARADVTYRQVDLWVGNHYLRPVGPASPGPGERRRFTRAEVEVACRMGRLTRAGLLPELAARVARQPGGRYELATGVWIVVEP